RSPSGCGRSRPAHRAPRFGPERSWKCLPPSPYPASAPRRIISVRKRRRKPLSNQLTPCLENGAELVFGHEVEKMAASVNKVILIGNLGRDPETRFTNSGTSVTNFSIATKESFADKSGTRQDRTDWHNIIVWGKQGEACAQYLKKGSPVYIEGRISYREYEAKDGSGK